MGLALAVAGCATAQPAGTSSLGLPAVGTAVTAWSGGLTVFAAASLTDVFTEIGQDFEAAHPGVTVSFQFDGSSTLARQINDDAPADVFAAADLATMGSVASTGRADSSQVFATNDLVLAVPADNPAGVTSLQDLSAPGLTVLACAPDVPCGAVAAQVCRAAGLAFVPASQEPNVTAVATKLSLGEADAGFVYSTDVAASDGKLKQIDLPIDQAVRTAAQTSYPIAVIKGSQQPDLAAALNPL